MCPLFILPSKQVTLPTISALAQKQINFVLLGAPYQAFGANNKVAALVIGKYGILLGVIYTFITSIS